MTIIYVLLSFVAGAACGVAFHRVIKARAFAALEKGKRELREEVEKAAAKLK